MKIGIVSQAYYPRFGGVSEHVGHSAAALARRGHDVTVITGRPLHVGHSSAHADPLLPGLDRVRIVRLGTSLLVPFQGAFVDLVVSPSLDGDLEALWRRERFELVHVHQPLTPSLPLLTTFVRPAPLVGTFHAAGARSRLFHFFRQPLAWHYSRLDLRLAVSPSARQFVTDQFAPPPLLVPNGVDTGRFRPGVAPPPGSRDGRFTVLFVGRLDPRKGLDVLLAAWPRVVHELSGEARLNVVGSSALAPFVRASVPRPLRSTIHFAGAVSARDLPGWYAAADVFCSPATRNESFGIVLLEAMSTGKPVVASDLPGYRAVCRPRAEGLSVPPGDPEALAAALTALARDTDLAQRLGRAGRRRAEEFDWARVGAALEDVYTDVLTGRPPRAPAALPSLEDAGAGAPEDAVPVSAAGERPPL
jgi:phosphatidylinositol alpha-mannosyltransferase